MLIILLLIINKKNIINKHLTGTTGTPIDLLANYFLVQKTPQWCLYQYHVDVSPQEDSTGVRKALLRVHAKTLGG